METTFEGRKIIFSSLVGSWAANLNTPISDEDWIHFVTPSFDDLYDKTMFYSTKMSAELDWDCHDIRKLGDWVASGNMKGITPLFGFNMTFDPKLAWILDSADELALVNLPAFYKCNKGVSQDKMENLHRGTVTENPLITRFGYNTKQAIHALRLLLVLERVMNTGSMRQALWFEGADRDLLLNVKAGELTKDVFITLVNAWHVNHGAEIEAWFMSRPVNNELISELNLRIKELIRQELRGQN